ncbi:MAG: hypothetical protein V4574_01400 [Pseudomonadota bacterium]
MTRRQVLFGSGAASIAWAGLAAPWNIARAAPLGGGARVRLSGTLSTELGGVVTGSYQLRALSVAHRTVV